MAEPTFIILARSARKLKTAGEIPAEQRYVGTMFKCGLKLARLKGWKVYILSAYYGLIEAETKIAWYDQKRTEVYEGPWPNGCGVYLGGELYFKNAPPRISRLVPKTGNGLMVKNTMKLIEAETRNSKKGFFV